MEYFTSKSDEGIYSYHTNDSTYFNPDAVFSISKVASFSYDNNGNLTNIASNSSNIATISWSYDNRVVKYKSSTASVSYQYDYTGQRIKVKSSTKTTYYPTKFYNTDGSRIIKHIFTPDGLLVATPIGTGASLSLHYVHTDHLRGTYATTNQDGAIESQYDYYAYGEQRIAEGSPLEQRRYIGEQFDSDTTLNYLNARYENGRWGRFISQDPS